MWHEAKKNYQMSMRIYIIRVNTLCTLQIHCCDDMVRKQVVLVNAPAGIQWWRASLSQWKNIIYYTTDQSALSSSQSCGGQEKDLMELRKGADGSFTFKGRTSLKEQIVRKHVSFMFLAIFYNVINLLAVHGNRLIWCHRTRLNLLKACWFYKKDSHRPL